MRWLLVIMLLTSIAISAKAADVPFVDGLPEGLPPVEKVEGGYFVPEDTAKALDLERQQCKVLPFVYQGYIDADREEFQIQMESEVKLAERRAMNQCLKTCDSGHSTFELGTWGVVGVLIGILAGGIAALVLVK